MGHFAFSRLRHNAIGKLGAVLVFSLAITVAACSSNEETVTPVPSPTVSISPTAGTPGATITVAPTTPIPSSGSPTITPTSDDPTSTPLPAIWTTLDTLECVRTHPGVPNPDGPNQWIDVTARITNPGDEPVQIGSIAPLTVTFYNAEGQLVATTKGPIPVGQFEPGQTHTVTIKQEEPELPSAVACRLTVNGPDNQPIAMGGLSETGITELALP